MKIFFIIEDFFNNIFLYFLKTNGQLRLPVKPVPRQNFFLNIFFLTNNLNKCVPFPVNDIHVSGKLKLGSE